MYKKIASYSKDDVMGKKHFHILKKNYMDISVPLHFHEYYEIEIIAGGSGRTILNGKEIPFHAGSVFFLTPMDYHQYLPSGEVTLYHLSFTHDVYSLVFDDSEGTVKTTFDFSGSDKFEALLHIFQALCCVTDTEFVYSALHAMFALFPRRTVKIAENRSYVQAATRYIRIHFRENISINTVADELTLSSDYLRRLFAEHYGITPNEYIRKIRLDYAMKLLKTTDLTITEIALQSGFQSLSSFNRTFKAHQLGTPRQYRRKS